MESPGSIQPIDRGSVHRICSGQVVLTLSTAVKELVENSLDADATNIEILLKEYGRESVEVIDNGSGVEESNIPGLTLKHHTSKLRDFTDLSGVETFGFRGEALSSLCALSKVTILTCHGTEGVGRRLQYDHHGHLVQQTPCARQRGTTVCLQHLFSTLPVRHKEFHRNLKKEFAKMIVILNAYCIVSTGVKITCTNHTGKGNRTVVVKTNGNVSMKDNITNIFGTKQTQSLLELHQYQPGEDVCSEFAVSSQQDEMPFKISGFVSSCDHGCGRSSTDRQFVVVNKRPCDLTKVVRLINEVYHSYNKQQYPFVVLDINTDREAVDVNVTPDKRQIFLQSEKLLLATIKASLVKLFEPRSSVYQYSHLSLASHTPVTKSSNTVPAGFSGIHVTPNSEGQRHSTQKQRLASSLTRLKRNFSSAFASQSPTASPQGVGSKQRCLDIFISRRPSSSETSADHGPCDDGDHGPCNQEDQLDEHNTLHSEERGHTLQHTCSVVLVEHMDHGPSVTDQGETRHEEVSRESEHMNNLDCDVSIHRSQTQCHTQSDHWLNDSRTTQLDPVNTSVTQPDSLHRVDLSQHSPGRTESQGISESSGIGEMSQTSDSEPILEMVICGKESTNLENASGTAVQREDVISGDDCPKTCDGVQEGCCEGQDGGTTGVSLRLPCSAVPSGSMQHTDGHIDGHSAWKDVGETQLIMQIVDEAEEVSRKQVSVPFSMKRLKERAKHVTHRPAMDKLDSAAMSTRSFHAKIAPEENSSAVEELGKKISKDMFAEMEILGQFNLGFIIIRLHHDLFIIDQHATDEKYNYEMLKQHTAIQSQKLIHPQRLELTAVNEDILMDNVDIFNRNGFEFVIDKNAPPTQRVRLQSIPVSRNWTFGKEDIEELIFMLTDSPGIMCRPSRICQMFASRSCRKSVMIGTSLNAAEMKKIVCHMGQIEQPWNCPHGRPTMRHLINMKMLPD